MRPLASPNNHENVKKAGDRIQFCPLRKTGFFVCDEIFHTKSDQTANRQLVTTSHVQSSESQMDQNAAAAGLRERIDR
ncbi:MAG: hypothetical protein ETSY1_06450 [Candidatus Entotheonella factor]|uniref:Uncharacterized protein n=1 Tax=Entotheonella factor TaxID=1429438 RepID=W4LV53_ENTF1|nr:MAG: hypothetical protein ETSY1_06450 [Candidatus Entotheonella factor]